MDAQLKLSIVMPCLNEAGTIVASLEALEPLRQRGAEVIVVDGGSTDATLALAESRADVALTGARGRALQMNAGAAQATGDILLFLHADTTLPESADLLVIAGLARSGASWGRFDVTIRGRHRLLRAVSRAMNLRSRVTAIATGDQALFVTRRLFECVGGYPEIALMEDIALSKTLRRRGAPLCLRARVTTSGRRWEKHGVWRTVLLMWRLRLAYSMGADPDRLALRYAAHR